MQTHARSRSTTPGCSERNRAYETTYQREFVLKRSSSIVEGIPLSQRFPIGCPFQLSGPVGETIYAMDYNDRKKILQEPFFRPNTNRANRPHPHKEFPYWPRRSESSCDLLSEETKQALRNQLDSLYQVDFTGAPQGFQIPMAYDRSHPFWRDRAQHTLDSEYRFSYQDLPKAAFHRGGRYGCSNRTPADAVVPQAPPVWKKKIPSQSIYGHEISQKYPSELFIREFVDSLSGPMAQ